MDLRRSGYYENSEEETVYTIYCGLSKSGLSGLSQWAKENYLVSLSFFLGEGLYCLVQMRCVHEIFSKVNIEIGMRAWTKSQIWHLWDLVNKVLFILAGRILKISPKQLEMLQQLCF